MIVNHTPKRPDDAQRMLFDVCGVGSLGACRYHVGNYFERRTAEFYNGVQLATTGAKGTYCPDVYREADATYYESKSVGNNGNVIIYEMRIHKDAEFAATHELFYVAWRHNLALKVWRNDFDSVDELRAALALRTLSHTRVRFRELFDYATTLPTRRLNTATTKSGSRLGYGQKGYGIGWTIPYSKLVELSVEFVDHAKK